MLLLAMVIFSGCELIGIEINSIGSSDKIEDSKIDSETIQLDKANNNENISTFTIANWNLQIFGQSKSNKENIMNFYTEEIQKYDIVFIQEIRDKAETAFPKLCETLPEYNCMTSSRAGRSSSKEQYGIIYKKGIEVKDFVDYNLENTDNWERAPIAVTFDINGYEFTAYNIHTKPDDVKNELSELEKLIDINNGNIMILGDLNADCSYYNEIKNPEFDNWNWKIQDNEDTTVSQTDCAYDRIILNDDLNKEYIQDEIYSN